MWFGSEGINLLLTHPRKRFRFSLKKSGGHQAATSNIFIVQSYFLSLAI